MNKTRVLVINYNTLKYTKNALEDLLNQNVPFDLKIIDQGSIQEGTQVMINSFKLRWVKMNKGKIDIVFNSANLPLNGLWNEFAKESENDYLCFLNSDVRIPKNFIKDSEDLLNIEKEVGITVHTTNHPLYYEKVGTLNYIIPQNQRIKQGWDFTIRKERWDEIPEKLRLFYGDDWIFYHNKAAGFKTAYILSSPIIHFQGCSQRPKNPLSKGITPSRRDNYDGDTKAWGSTGLPHNHHPLPEYTRIKPNAAMKQKYG